MKNTLKTLAVSAVVVSSLILGNCFADELPIKENMNKQTIVVEGSVPVAEDKVLIEVINNNPEDKENYKKLEGIIVTDSKADGTYSVEFKLPASIKSGMKKVAVKPLVGSKQEGTLEFFSASSITDILTKWNAAIDGQDISIMDKVVNNEENLDALKIILSPASVSAKELISEQGKEEVNVDFLTQKLLTLGKVENAEALEGLHDEFVKVYVNFAINKFSDYDTASKLILEFYNLIDTQKGDAFTNIINLMEENDKKELFKDALEHKSEATIENGEISNENFVKHLYKRAVYNEFCKITYYQDVKKFIDTYNTEEYFNINFSEYNKLKNTYEVDSKVVSNRSAYSNFDTFREKYYSWINEQKAIEADSEKNVSKSSAGSSGSKGTSSGGGGGVVPVKENIFNDIEGYDWAEEHIMNLYNKGVINGVGNKDFAPANTVTREQFVKMASVLCDMPEEIADAGFEDVSKDEWYEKSINAAKQIGLISGQSETKFGVGESITRQDAALVMFNAIKISKPDIIDGLELQGLSFNDSGDVSSYAIYAISVLNKLGVINGDDHGNLMPLSNATRAEAAVMINKVLSLID